MMNDDDRKFLTEWGGECWHEGKSRFKCDKCGAASHGHINDDNRTFDNWTDFGWLWSKILEWEMFEAFWHYLMDVSEYINKQNALLDWMSEMPPIRIQLICDFLREGRT